MRNKTNPTCPLVHNCHFLMFIPQNSANKFKIIIALIHHHPPIIKNQQHNIATRFIIIHQSSASQHHHCGHTSLQVSVSSLCVKIRFILRFGFMESCGFLLGSWNRVAFLESCGFLLGSWNHVAFFFIYLISYLPHPPLSSQDPITLFYLILQLPKS